MNSTRVTITAAVVVAFILFFFLVPFSFWPFRMDVRGLAVVQVAPDHVRKVVVPEGGGFLAERKVVDGQRVSKGDLIAILKNPDLEMQAKLVERAALNRHEQVIELGTMVISTGSSDDRFGQEAILAEKMRDGLRQQHRDLTARLRGLRLLAPRDGVVMKLAPIEQLGRRQEQGAVICEIGDPEKLRALLLVDPGDRSLVEENLIVEGESKAWIRVHGLRYNYWRGTVEHIGVHDAKDIPPQLSDKAGGDVITEADPETKAERPAHQHYVISVKFDEIDPAMHPGVTGRVKIAAKPRTLAWRLWRYVRTQFSLGL